MNTLLINPPIRLQKPPYIHPIGLAIIAQMLRDAGHDVAIADINAERDESGAIFQPPKRRPDWIGISGIISAFRVQRELMPFLRDKYPGVPIVIGGGGATSAPETYLEALRPDIVAIGEGEYTALELASHFETGHPGLDDIAGIAYPKNGNIHYTLPRPLEKNLDNFPDPAFDLLNMEAYITHPKYSTGEREVAILATRGCAFGCKFCYHVFGRGARYRGVNRVLAEVGFLKDNYGIDSILWADEFWTANKKWAREFCTKLIDKDWDLEWMCYSRTDVVDGEILELMETAGCTLVGFGLESGSQRILDAMNKKTKVDINRRAWNLVKKHGMRVSGTLIFGYPGEDESTVQETIRFCKGINHRGTIFFLAPYPGTAVFEEYKDLIIGKFGGLTEFFSQLGEAADFVINLTEWPDEWLILRKQAMSMELAAHRVMEKAEHGS